VNTGLYAELLEALSGTVREFIKFVVGYLFAHEIEGRIVRPSRRGVLKDLLDWHQRNIGIPSDARGIRFDPRLFGHGFPPLRPSGVLSLRLVSLLLVCAIKKEFGSERNEKLTQRVRRPIIAGQPACVKSCRWLTG
jgi:hypothetical protein